jgi:hypothetical protein
VGRSRSKRWIWVVAVIALLAGGAAVAVNVTKDDATDADEASVATDDESTDDSTDPTSPLVTDSILSEASEPIVTPEATAAAAPTGTSATASDEVAGSPAGAKGDRASPVPVGSIADIGGGWRLQIVDINPDAAAAIAEENPFNEPPPAGSTLTLITVALGYFGLEDPKTVFEVSISAVGSGNVELAAQCGLVPQDLLTFSQVFSGAVVLGNVCFVTTPEDIPALQLYASGDLFGGDDVFLDASTTPADVVPMASLAGPQTGAASTAARLSPTPIGMAADIGEGWTLTVNTPASDVTDAVLAANDFNAPPPDGFRFIGVNVTYAYSGEGSASGFSVSANAVGDSNLSLSNQCGVTPDAIDLMADLFSGGSVSGGLCFVVPSGSPNLVLYATANFLGTNVMFATS